MATNEELAPYGQHSDIIDNSHPNPRQIEIIRHD